MKITIESTDQIVTLSKGTSEIPARVWEGETENGVKVVCLITRIAARKDQDLRQFDAELRECRPPSPEQVFPLRMIL
jgi:hypothetical protein